MHHPVQPVQVLRDPLGQRSELALVGHVELEHGRRVGQPPGDPLHQAEPAEPGQHDPRALLLGDARDVERDRRVGENPGDQDPLAVQDAHGGYLRYLGERGSGDRLSGPCRVRRRPAAQRR